VKDQQEEWLELCKQASVEQDREKLFHLVRRVRRNSVACTTKSEN